MENLPIKHFQSIFLKVKNFFKNLFCEFTNKGETDLDKDGLEIKENVTEQFTESIKTQITNQALEHFRKKELLEEIEKNPDLLEILSLERLQQLNEYYDEIIADYKEKISKLKQVG